MLLPLDRVSTVGLAGAGSVGAGWTALLLATGYNVIAFDPDNGAPERLARAVERSWPMLVELNERLPVAAPLERLKFVASLRELAENSDLVQENVAESLHIKGPVIRELDAFLPPDRLILSSSGGVPPSEMQAGCRHPNRVLVGHPFHPAHLVPLVEIVPGSETSQEAVDLALGFYMSLGKRPITVRKEMTGHLVNRLQFAVIREAVHCLSEDVASAEDIDAAMRWALGLRWALLGPLMTFNLAGGPGGIEQLLDRFHDDVERWWAALGTPRLSSDVCEKLRQGVVQLRHGKSNQEWEAWRDARLVELLRFRAGRPYPTEENVLVRETGNG